jgi:hypothetical protein
MGKDKKKIGMDAFNVVKKATEGVKMPLNLPDGTPTEHFIVVRGADSTRFRGAKAKYNRELAKGLKSCKDDAEKQEALQDETTRKMVAALVVDWSFDTECNETNIRKFLADSPQIQEQIDSFAGVRSNFFVKPPQD